MARRDEGEYPWGSSTEEQRSQPAFSAKTLRAAGLLPAACVGSDLTARCGDARSSPPWPTAKIPRRRIPRNFKTGSQAVFRTQRCNERDKGTIEPFASLTFCMAEPY